MRIVAVLVGTDCRNVRGLNRRVGNSERDTSSAPNREERERHGVADEADEGESIIVKLALISVMDTEDTRTSDLAGQHQYDSGRGMWVSGRKSSTETCIECSDLIFQI